MNKNILGLNRIDLAMIATTLIWGLNYTVVKQTLYEMKPMVFVSLRFALAAAFVVAILHFNGENLRFHRDDLWKLLLLGLIGNTLHQTLFTQGIARTTASNSSLISATNPIFVTVLSGLLRLEEVSPLVGAGVILSFVGTSMLIGFGSSGLSFADSSLVGNLLTLGAALCWSFYTLAARRMMRRYSPLKITSLTMLVGSPFLLLISAGELAGQNWQSITWHGWLGLGYAFVFSSVIAYVIWNTSVNACGNARTAVYANLIPLVAVAVSWFALGERLVLWQGIGAAVTLVGVTLTRVAPRKSGAECA
jgi:drug/metabolite transporter (DMT)-like permease